MTSDVCLKASICIFHWHNPDIRSEQWCCLLWWTEIHCAHASYSWLDFFFSHQN